MNEGSKMRMRRKDDKQGGRGCNKEKGRDICGICLGLATHSHHGTPSLQYAGM